VNLPVRIERPNCKTRTEVWMAGGWDLADVKHTSYPPGVKGAHGAPLITRPGALLRREIPSAHLQ
jgi:hypothetical protein